MHKLGFGITLALFLAIGSVALATGGSPDERGQRGHSITLHGKTAQLNLVDAGEPGFTLGDQVAFSDDLRTKSGGKAGFDGGACTLIRITDADAQSGTAQCQVTYSLEGGQVTTQGLFTLTNGGFVGTQVAAITGGTGRFDRARGESRLQFVNPGELVITLDLAGETGRGQPTAITVPCDPGEARNESSQSQDVIVQAVCAS